MSSSPLNDKQTQALFNILTHFETYREIESLKEPATIRNFGYPFASSTKSRDDIFYAPESSSPLLQSLLTNLVLTQPGMSSIAPEFWHDRIQGLLKKLAEADLSESYEKGSLGTRKTLATAYSSVLEMLARGFIGGAPYSDPARRPLEYHLDMAEDLSRAWDDAVHDLVYENLCDELLDHMTETADFEAHSPMVRAVVEYMIIHLATLLHQVLVASPEGPYLVKLMENVHTMIPYAMVRQTLRVGNAANMIYGMMKIFLAKMSVGSVSNWLGMTQKAAEGMNLLQRIISVIIGWDCAEFKKTIDRISKAKNRPSQGALNAISLHCQAPKSQREAVRAKSLRESKSVITVILWESNPVLLRDLKDEEHQQCLEYYAALLAIRDREEISAVACKQNPDLLTQAIRDILAGMDPIIRAIHNKVDLSDYFKDMQAFLDQLIATSKPKSKKGQQDPPLPTVEDYVQLIRNNKQMLYKWLHSVCKNCPEVMDGYRSWVRDSLVLLQKRRNGDSIETKLGQLFSQLPDESKATFIPIIDAHAAYLQKLEGVSRARMQSILEKRSSTSPGPGVYLALWQSLMDETLITPASVIGPVRQGKDVKGTLANGKQGIVSQEAQAAIARTGAENSSTLPEAPDVKPVIEALAPLFRKMIPTVTKPTAIGQFNLNGSIDQFNLNGAIGQLDLNGSGKFL